jgi:ribosomal protein L3
VTSPNIQVLSVDLKNNTFLLQGSVAGNRKQVIFVRKSIRDKKGK